MFHVFIKIYQVWENFQKKKYDMQIYKGVYTINDDKKKD